MKNNLRMYDTGKVGSYSRRNEGWTFASMFGGGMLAVAGFALILGGIFDPMAPLSVLIVGLILFVLPLLHGAGFVTHRNFGLTKNGVQVMDAIYSLPKKDRKKFKISKAEIDVLNPYEAEEIVGEIREYRRNRTTGNGLGLLLSEITEYNKVVREIEGDKVSPGVRGGIEMNRRKARGY